MAGLPMLFTKVANSLCWIALPDGATKNQDAPSNPQMAASFRFGDSLTSLSTYACQDMMFSL